MTSILLIYILPWFLNFFQPYLAINHLGVHFRPLQSRGRALASASRRGLYSYSVGRYNICNIWVWQATRWDRLSLNQRWAGPLWCIVVNWSWPLPTPALFPAASLHTTLQGLESVQTLDSKYSKPKQLHFQDHTGHFIRIGQISLSY